MSTLADSVGEQVTLVLLDGTSLKGNLRQALKKSAKILNDEGIIEFVRFEDIQDCVVLHETEDHNIAPGAIQRLIAVMDKTDSGGCDEAEKELRSRRKPQRFRRKDAKCKLLVVLDIETGDPDDILTLMFAACHPRVDLKAVTVSPGSEEQIRLIRHVLTRLKVSSNVKIGARDWPANRNKRGCADLAFYNNFLYPDRSEVGSRSKKGSTSCDRIGGKVEVSNVSPAADVIREECDASKDVTLFTGGPLHNLGEALERGATIPRWVGQGGFCGEGVVPNDVPTLPQFEGRTHVQSWNFGGSVNAAMLALESPDIFRRVLVGKNVCHRCRYNDRAEARLRARISDMPASKHKEALEWIHKALSAYTKDDGFGTKEKKLHDPLAFATLLDEEVCNLREVRVGREGGCWGSVLCDGTNTFAAIDFSYDFFLAALLCE